MHTSLLGMLANLGLALSQGVAGMVGHSFALVADGFESLSDVLSGFVVYLGLKIQLSLLTKTTLTATVRRNRSRR